MLLFYYVNYVILSVHRILYVTTCRCTAGSCGCRMKELARVPGGWSIATPNRANPPVAGKSGLPTIWLSLPVFLSLLTANCQERCVYLLRRATTMESTGSLEKRRGRSKKIAEALRNGGLLAEPTSSPSSSVGEGLDLFPDSPLPPASGFQLSSDFRYHWALIFSFKTQNLQNTKIYNR